MEESANFQLHEEIKGQTSDARAILIDYNSGGTSYYYMISGRFQENEFVVGQTSNSQATLTSVKQVHQTLQTDISLTMVREMVSMIYLN